LRQNQGHRFKHASDKLLECIRVSRFLKAGADSLAEIVKRCLDLALPKVIPFHGFGQKVEGLPSKSTVRHSELPLDIALLLLQRSRSDVACVRYSWSDSSPMAGFDWLWAQHHEIALDDLVETFTAVVAVHDACRAASVLMTDGDDETVDLVAQQDVANALATIAKNIREHIHPPAALRSGGRGIADKARALFFAWALQIDTAVPLLSYTSSFFLRHPTWAWS
jgi:hypothetical protein